MLWFPEDWIDEVVSRNDIVDVVSEYVVLNPVGEDISDFVRSIMKRLPPSMCLPRDNSIIVLDVVKEAMLFPLLWAWSGWNLSKP